MANWLRSHFYLLVALYAATIFISNDAFLPAIPIMSDDLDVADGQALMAVTVFVFGSISVQFIVGPLSDAFGRKAIMLGGGLVFMLATWVCGLSDNIAMLLSARFCAGATMSCIFAGGFAAINEYYGDDNAVRALSLSANVTMLAPMLGPVIGAFILQFHTWHYIFFYDALLMAAVLVLLVLYMPETNLRLLQGRETRLNLRSVFSPLLVVARNRRLMISSAAFGLSGAVFMMWITGSTIMLMKNLGLSAADYAVWQIPVFVCLLFSNNLAPKLSRKVGLDRYVARVFWLVGLAAIPFAIASLFETSLLGVMLPMCMFAFVKGLQNAPFNQYVLRLEKVYKGTAASLYSFVNGIFGVLGALSASLLAEHSNASYQALMAVLVASSMIVGWYALRINKSDAS
ncbi:MFS transporter [Alginatibacterium sediminis]|nr:MFS transporter [Alginatibacterium sediminis]